MTATLTAAPPMAPGAPQASSTEPMDDDFAAMTGLSGQVALITGASGGIGAAIADRLGRLGARLALVGRRAEALESVLESAGGKGAGLALRCDLTEDEALAGIAPAVIGRFGRLDILVHCAGTIVHGTLEAAEPDGLDAQFATNVRSPYRLTRACLPHLVAARGHVVFVNSSVVRAAGGGRGAYAATKHALKSFADSLREEVNPAGVRVTTIYPGSTATARQARLCAEAGRPYKPERLIQPRDIALVIGQVLALPRTAEITDIHMRPMTPP